MTPEEILKKQERKIIKKSKSESLAKLEEDLFDAESKGNTRQARAIKMIIKRLKNLRAPK